MDIVLQFDSSFANAAPGVKAAIQQAAAILDTLITDPITVTIDVSLDAVGGVKLPLGALGAELPTGLQSYSYSQVSSALAAHANTPLAQQIAANLPSQAQAGQSISLFPAQAYALGLSSPTQGAVDGYVGFRSDIPVNAGLDIYLHELTHALGRVRDNSLLSLYSYSAPGVLAGDQNATGAAYFSINGGATSLAKYDLYSDVSDWGDWTDPTYTGGTTNVDLLTALGFHVNAAPVATSQIPFQNWGTGGSFREVLTADFPQTADFFNSSAPMTYSATLADGSPLPSWLSFDPATLAFLGNLPSGISTLSVKLTASNSLGSASEIFDAGTPIRTSAAIINEHLKPGASFSLNLNSFFTGPVNSQTQFYVSLAQTVGQAYNIWNQTNLPSWMHLDQATHILSGTMPAQGGLYDLEVGAWNADGNVSLGGANTLLGLTTASINLSTISPPMAVQPMASQAVAWGQHFTIQLPNPAFTDSSATVTSFSLGGQDFNASTQYASPPQLPWTSFDPATSTISGTAPSSGTNIYHLQITATDGNGSVGGEDFYVFLGDSITANELYVLSAVGVPIPVHTLADTVANIKADIGIIDEHIGSGGVIQNVQFTDAGPVVFSAGQIQVYAQVLDIVSSPSKLAVQDNAADVVYALDQIEILAVAGSLASISLTDGGTPTLTLSATQFNNDVLALEKLATPFDLVVSGKVSAGNAAIFESHWHGVLAIADSAANVGSNLDALQALAKSGQISSLLLTDSSLATLTVSAAQFSADAAALNAITSPHAVTVQMSGAAARHSFAGENWAGANALQFADQTVIVAATPGGADNVTTGNVTELYSAVLAREPDVGGLAFYQNYLKSNPATPLQTFADFFLNSTEYKSSRTYAAGTAGDTQFINDSYQNLLHRTPSASEVDFYLTHVMNQPDAHALMLVYFSASSEFLGDVQITAANPASASHWLLLD